MTNISIFNEATILTKTNELDQKQKELSMDFANLLLKQNDPNKNYKVEFNEGGLIVRMSLSKLIEDASANNSQERAEQLKQTMKKIDVIFNLCKKLKMIVSEETVKSYEVNNRDYNIKIYLITSLNLKHISILMESVNSKPENVSENVWEQLPREIKENWKELDHLHEFIIKCREVNLAEKFNAFASQLTVVFGQSFQSPVGLTPAEYPVKFYNDPKHYDLVELIKTEPKRIPHNRKPFTLKDIQPDEEALKALENRGNQATAVLRP